MKGEFCKHCGEPRTDKTDMLLCIKHWVRYQRDWRQNKGPTETNKATKRWRDTLRLETLIHYSNSNPPRCVCCGETTYKFLTIDHTDGHGREHRAQIGKNKLLAIWLRRNGFPEGYQILCYNCNCGKSHNNNICPHKTPETQMAPVVPRVVPRKLPCTTGEMVPCDFINCLCKKLRTPNQTL